MSSEVPVALRPQFTHSSHLVDLIAEAERLTGLIESTDAAQAGRIRNELLDTAAVATLRLDGSRLTQPPPLDVLASALPPGAKPTNRSGPWLDAFATKLEDTDLQQVQAIEFVGARVALEADDLVEVLSKDPLRCLTELHRRLTQGLLTEQSAGVPRMTEQAVHDASTGRIIYFAVEPELVASRLAALEAWATSEGAREHGLVLSGVMHHELLVIHPFEAANGRLARSAARIALRARGLDPLALGCPEAALATDPLGYWEQVARTLRRRDLTIWLEHWGEAVVRGLRDTARRLHRLSPQVPDRAQSFCASLPTSEFTVADYRATVGVGPQEARADLQALLESGRVVQKLGSRGLRFERR